MNTFVDKKEARKFFLEKRKSISADEMKQRSAALCEHICSLNEFKNADTVLLFAPTRNEPDLLGVAFAAWADGKEVAFPISRTADCTLDFRKVSSIDALELGAYGILEPSESAPSATVTERTLCIVPALAVDGDGFRLGYGKGYYDRFLKNFKGTSVCALPNGFSHKSLPHDENDIPVDITIFETGVQKAK